MGARGRGPSRSATRTLFVAALLVIAQGCATTRTLRSREEFSSVPTGQPIRVFAQHDRVYLFRDFTLADTLVRGSGTVTERAHTTHFEGDIPFSQIVAITSSSPSVMKTLLLAGVTVLFVAAVADIHGSGGLDPKAGTTRHEPASSSGGGFGSSCPYVYAWDGSRYVLAAEPFGTALGRALETTTTHLLPAERSEDGIVRLQLANERRETHFVNSVRVSAIELGSAPAAVLDVEGTAWPLFHPAAPISARDRSGRDILSRIAMADGRSWECDSTDLRAGSGYEDVLELTFARPARAVAGSLVLTGINTTFSSALYEQMCRSVGSDATPALARALETDPELIAEVKDYLRDASLSVAVWDGRAWVDAGAYPPEANAVAFTRALRIHVPEGVGDSVRVRLRSMADVWRIDAISLDWGDREPLPVTPLRLVSARDPSGRDVRDELGADDARYTILLTPDRIALAYAAPVRRGHRVAYAVAARGYLMEWDPPHSGDGTNVPAAWSPEDRITMLEQMLRHRDLVLGPAYAEWRRSRSR